MGLAAARLIWVRGPERVLALAAMLTVAEWLRGHLLSGFPWNTFGYALTEPLALAQSVSLIGIWGLTFLCVAICASPAVLADDAADTPHPRRAPLLGIVILAGLAGYGAVRLWQNPTDLCERREAAHHAAQSAAGREIQLRRQDAGDGALSAPVRPRHRAELERRARRHASDLAGIGVSVFPDARAGRAGADRGLAETVGTELITGAVRAGADASGNVPHAYNSIYVIDPDGSIRGIYDKVHLVPFGEYLPFQGLLERLGLRQLTKQVGGFLSGDRRRAMDVPRRAEDAAADLLRGDLSRRRGAARRTAGLAGQRHQ